MFKALTLGALCVSALGLRIDSYHNQPIVTSADDMSDKQKQWDDFFRSEIDALGDSKFKKVTGDNNIEYLDTTNDN